MQIIYWLLEIHDNQNEDVTIWNFMKSTSEMKTGC